MKRDILLIYKYAGETPLDAIRRIKKANPVLQEETISYAGRLDPMAEGLLLLLAGEENKKRKAYENFPKTYIVDILLGIATDSYDLLGEITRITLPSLEQTEKAKKIIASLPGKFLMTYPPYSSKPVNGKPLYTWARKRQLHTISLPQKEVEIFSVSHLTIKDLPGEQIGTHARKQVTLVHGDFRQEEISTHWEEFTKSHKTDHFPLLRVEITCSSGTYMRSLAHHIGEQLETGALAYKIERIKIGEFTYADISVLDESAIVK